jgi:hypothetical protein
LLLVFTLRSSRPTLMISAAACSPHPSDIATETETATEIKRETKRKERSKRRTRARTRRRRGRTKKRKRKKRSASSLGHLTLISSLSSHRPAHSPLLSQDHGSQRSPEPSDCRSRSPSSLLSPPSPSLLSLCPPGHYGKIRESEIPVCSASEDIHSLILSVGSSLFSPPLSSRCPPDSPQEVGLTSEDVAAILRKFTPSVSSLRNLRKLDLSGNRSLFLPSL